MRSFTIQGVALPVEFFKLCQGIRDSQQRAVPIVTCTLEQKCWRHIQVYHPTRIVEPCSIFRIQHDTTTGSQNDIRSGRQLCDGLHFATAKPFLTLNFEDGWYWHTGSLDNFVVGIIELTPQSFGQLTPYRCFTGPHQPHEIDVFSIIHTGILSDSELSPKERAGIAGPSFGRNPIDQLICNLSERMRGVMKNSSSRR